MKNSILLVEDILPLARIYEAYLREERYDVLYAENAKSAIKILTKEAPAAVLLDMLLPDSSGLKVLDHCRNLYPSLPVIVMVTKESPAMAEDAMRHGAYDFIMKPFQSVRLATTLARAMEHKSLTGEVTEWRQLVGQTQYHGLAGQSPPMLAVYRAIESMAESPAPVLIRGEGGAGKEMAAQAVHAAGPRRLKPFIILNCAGTSHELIESALFGHTDAAFPGGKGNRPGALRNANDGTLFLKEACEMPVKIQEKLLQFIQTGQVFPVGGIGTDPCDVRIIAATVRDPAEEIKNGRLHEGLYRQLQTLTIEMPPLRDRDNDIMLLASHFLTRFSAEEGKRLNSLAPEVMQIFRRHPWPGNVRQMENLIQSIVRTNEGSTVMERMLPKDLKNFGRTGKLTPSNPDAQDLMLVDYKQANAVTPLWVMEMETIMQALEYTQHDIGKAAALLEVSPSTLYRKIRVWQNPEDLISKPMMRA